MKIFQNLKQITSLLQPYSGHWAVCGGIAACIYREVPRFTGDIDIALIDTEDKSAIQIAEVVLSALGYAPKLGCITDQNGKLLKGQALVIGREIQASSYFGVDFLLPVIPWVDKAVVRAQNNLLDFGFELLPTITVEDLCLAKMYALQGTPTRGMDREDIVSILKTSPVLDKSYLERRCRELSLEIPQEFSLLLPPR